jgi:hypothetical protein
MLPVADGCGLGATGHVVDTGCTDFALNSHGDLVIRWVDQQEAPAHQQE